MKCPRCHQDNSSSTKFCRECGARIAEAPAAKFASPEAYTPKHLAEKILSLKSALEGEHKQVTVLFCDIENSTGLAERVGPEAMHVVLDAFFGIALTEVHRYEGTINQFLGDGFMALFGAPLTHEDDARRAVLAALAVRERLHERQIDLGRHGKIRLAVRLALNTGPVVVGKIGDDLRMDYTAVGDTTNLAAHLRDAAEPHTILITDATSRLLAGDVRLEALPPIKLKGKTEVVKVYRVGGLGPRRASFGNAEHPPSPLVGRERELSALHDVLRQVPEGRGRVVAITGEPGIGKSRLLYEFQRGIKGQRVTYLEGRCLSYGNTIPYLPLQDIVRENCDIIETDTAREIVEKLRDRLERLSLNAGEAVPYLLQLLGVREGTEVLAEISPETIKTRIFDTVRQMSLNGSQSRPLILTVEDVQWIDKTSEEFFATLAKQVADAPILLLTTHRPDYHPSWVNQPHGSQITLGVLPAQDSLNLLRSIVAPKIFSDSVARVILDRAEGNPFFLEELARVVTERAEFGSMLPVPDTIHGVLMARIDRLPDQAKRVLQAASVLGREVSARLLNAVWGDCEVYLAELTQADFLYERPASDGPTYLFKHALTQQVAYDSLLSSRRAGLHLAAARALEAIYADRLEQVYDRLAHHYSRTDNSERAVQYLTRFADLAARRYAHVEAVLALQEARAHVEQLGAADSDRRFLELLLREAGSLYFLGRAPEALDLLLRQRDRIERLQNVALAATYFFQVGFTFNVLGDHHRAAEWEQLAIEGAARIGDQAILGKAHYVLAYGHTALGQLLKAAECAQQAVSHLLQTEEHWWLGMAHWVMGLASAFRGEFDAALAAEARANAIGQTMKDPRLLSFSAWTTGIIHATRGEWDAGIEACRRAVDHSPDPVNTAYASGSLGYAYLEKGEAESAINLLEGAIQKLSQFRVRQLHGWFSGVLSEAYLLRGQPDKALESARRALEIAEATDFAFGWAWTQRALGRIACASGSFTTAATHLDSALEAFTSLQARFEVARTHLAFAQLALRAGDHPRLRSHAWEAQNLFRTLRIPKYEKLALQCAETPESS